MLASFCISSSERASFELRRCRSRDLFQLLPSLLFLCLIFFSSLPVPAVPGRRQPPLPFYHCLPEFAIASAIDNKKDSPALCSFFRSPLLSLFLSPSLSASLCVSFCPSHWYNTKILFALELFDLLIIHILLLMLLIAFLLFVFSLGLSFMLMDFCLIILYI